MKHRPSWNHLDLKQMHWLFSQQAFLLGAGTGTLARAVWKGFQPPASVCYSLWHDQYQGEQQRKLREDYEDEVSDSITAQDLFFLSPWSSSVSDLAGTPSGQQTKKERRTGGKGHQIPYVPRAWTWCLCMGYNHQARPRPRVNQEQESLITAKMNASISGRPSTQQVPNNEQLGISISFYCYWYNYSPVCTFLP